jgi:catechol 2,3-dioxygenase
MEIAAETRIGMVSLSVADLARSLTYYRQVIGLRVIKQLPGEAVLGAGDFPLLSLFELPGADRAPNSTGLYHFALLVPSRFELARTLQNLVENHAMFVGFADHHVSEAIYLTDPDGHGIEIYRDRPREQWRDPDGNFFMTTEPLDVRAVMAELAPGAPPWGGIHDQTTMGHIHLHVDDIPRARFFYQDVLGFEVMAALHSAEFLSAGGYHHHIGVNIWNGIGAPPPPHDSLRLLGYEILLPDGMALQKISENLDRNGMVYQRSGSSLVLEDPASNPVTLRQA